MRRLSISGAFLLCLSARKTWRGRMKFLLWHKASKLFDKASHGNNSASRRNGKAYGGSRVKKALGALKNSPRPVAIKDDDPKLPYRERRFRALRRRSDKAKE